MTSDHIAEHKIDRSRFAPGPWDDEPDRMEWRDEATGLPCLIVRNRMGGLCGYAGVAPDHPLFGVNYDQESAALRDRLERRKEEPVGDIGLGQMVQLLSGDIRPTPEMAINVHGGLTYSDRCHGAICHVPQPGESDDTWWFGFDCGHCGDLQPGLSAYFFREGEVYRDVSFVRRQVSSLAKQLADLAA